MSDKTIVFTARAIYRQLDGETVYDAGQIETMRDDMADRWIGRGVATDDPEAVAKAKAAKESPAPEPAPAAPDPVPPPSATRGRRSII